MYWELFELARKLAMGAIGVFAVDGAFNSSKAVDVSGALSPVIQPFLGQLVTVLSLVAVLYVQPYAKGIHNVVQATCLLATWACMLVGSSLFNTATTTGAIGPHRQDGIGIFVGVALCLWVAAVLLWALEGYATDMWDTVCTRFPTLGIRAGSSGKVVPLMLDAELGHRKSSVGVTQSDCEEKKPETVQVVGDDAAHAQALAQIDSHDIDRQPRKADGQQYKPSKNVAGFTSSQ
jgi:hypothetical protein